MELQRNCSSFFYCSLRTKADDDVYNFGFILFESLVGPIACDRGETFFLNEKVSAFLNICLFLLDEYNYYFNECNHI